MYEGCKLQVATLPPELATLLNKDRQYLSNQHLTPMITSGRLSLRYAESAKHPHKVYLAPENKGQHETD